MKNKVIVIGVGRLGASIATESSEEGADVIVVDKNPLSFNRLPPTFSGYQIAGDILNVEVLENVNFKNAKEVVITTDDDNLNILIAHICLYKYDVPEIYIRLDDVNKAQLVDDLRVNAIYPFTLSVNDYRRHKEERND
jgi:trk system potassium uptake protein TrkA